MPNKRPRNPDKWKKPLTVRLSDATHLQLDAVSNALGEAKATVAAKAIHAWLNESPMEQA